MVLTRLTLVNVSRPGAEQDAVLTQGRVRHFVSDGDRMSVKHWISRSIIAGLAGAIVHFMFMRLKAQMGLLPEFQPYESFQLALSRWVGADVPMIVPWALSFLNGMTILGFLFARMNRLLPGSTGAAKGVIFGLIGWIFMGLIFFPMIGLGPFAIQAGSGAGPALLSLVMLQTYSIVLGTVYAALDAGRR
jgi:hypothetical protein